MSRWPTVELDPVRRLRVLAAGLPHVVLRERVLAVPFARVWGFVEDLERSAPVMELGIRRVEILQRDGERLDLRTVGPLGASQRFDVVLRPGWCLMRSRLADIGMAAAPEGDGTRFAHYEGTRWAGRVARPLLARKIEGDLDRLEHHLSDRGRS